LVSLNGKNWEKKLVYGFFDSTAISEIDIESEDLNFEDKKYFGFTFYKNIDKYLELQEELKQFTEEQIKVLETKV
jgi:hypothetical protein